MTLLLCFDEKYASFEIKLNREPHCLKPQYPGTPSKIFFINHKVALSGIHPTSSLLVMRQFGHCVKVATLHITNLY